MSAPESVEHDDVVESKPHELAHLGISIVTRTDGKIVARGPGMACPSCRGESDRQADCAVCAGRGQVNDVPHCDREWDEILTFEGGGSLWLGGHACQPGGGECQPGDRFDLVVSLYNDPAFAPGDGVEHLTHKMIDGPLHPEDHPIIEALADRVAEVMQTRPVLVRCLAGMNRSGLVAALAAMKAGVSLDDFLSTARAARGPWVLFNDAFVDHLRTRETDLRRVA